MRKANTHVLQHNEGPQDCLLLPRDSQVSIIIFCPKVPARGVYCTGNPEHTEKHWLSCICSAQSISKEGQLFSWGQWGPSP